MIQVTRAQAVERARSAVAQGCQYRLGKGGFIPEHGYPWTLAVDGKFCDCSGFVAWCLGVSRQNPSPAMLWLETTAVAHDAMGGGSLFAQVPWKDALPGDVLVWGDRKGKQGHIGLVATRDDSGPLTVVHCSSGNFRSTSDAIRETTADIFRTNSAIAAAFVHMAETPAA